MYASVARAEHDEAALNGSKRYYSLFEDSTDVQDTPFSFGL